MVVVNPKKAVEKYCSSCELDTSGIRGIVCWPCKTYMTMGTWSDNFYIQNKDKIPCYDGIDDERAFALENGLTPLIGGDQAYVYRDQWLPFVGKDYSPFLIPVYITKPSEVFVRVRLTKVWGWPDGSPPYYPWVLVAKGADNARIYPAYQGGGAWAWNVGTDNHGYYFTGIGLDTNWHVWGIKKPFSTSFLSFYKDGSTLRFSDMIASYDKLNIGSMYENKSFLPIEINHPVVAGNVPIECDWVEIRDEDGKVLYREDFDASGGTITLNPGQIFTITEDMLLKKLTVEIKDQGGSPIKDALVEVSQ